MQEKTQHLPTSARYDLETLLRLRQIIQENMSDAEKKLYDELQRTGLGTAFATQYIIKQQHPEAEQYFTNDKNSYGYWGPIAEQIVKTPQTLWIPTSLDAFKSTGLREIYTTYNDYTKNAIDESVDAAIAIENWAYENKLNEFFLKNANFSAKHRWPTTCNIDYTFLPEQTCDKRVAHTLRHMNNINSYALLYHTTPGLGWVARKKLDLEPYFYAFGTTIYKITNPENGDTKVLEYNGREDVRQYFIDLQKSNPNFKISWKHIGMPITKELRVFSINGDIVGYVPYWSPAAFKNQSVYGIDNDFNFDDAIKKLNKFEKSDLEHIHNETNKIITHNKFHDTDWAIDWIKTRNGDWYMTDMQTAEGSYLDYNNMIFAHSNAQQTVQEYMINHMNTLIRLSKNMSFSERAMMILMNGGRNIGVEERLAKLGYPDVKTLQQVQKTLRIGR